jgi:hypothetical protein
MYSSMSKTDFNKDSARCGGAAEKPRSLVSIATPVVMRLRRSIRQDPAIDWSGLIAYPCLIRLRGSVTRQNISCTSREPSSSFFSNPRFRHLSLPPNLRLPLLGKRAQPLSTASTLAQGGLQVTVMPRRSAQAS